MNGKNLKNFGNTVIEKNLRTSRHFVTLAHDSDQHRCQDSVKLFYAKRDLHVYFVVLKVAQVRILHSSSH